MRNATRSYQDIRTIFKNYDTLGVDVPMIYTAAMEFSQEYIAPLNKLHDELNTFPYHVMPLMGDYGLLGPTIPMQYGGSDAGYLAHYSIIQAISYYSGGIALSTLAHSNLFANQLKLNGTEKQKELYLPEIVAGTRVGALMMSEPNYGSNVMGMQTYAQPITLDNQLFTSGSDITHLDPYSAQDVGDGFVINGEKTWITNGGHADHAIVYAKTGARDGNKLTAFIVPRDTSGTGANGFMPVNKIDKMGMRASETWQIKFDNCFVPRDNVLGEVGKGSHVLMSGLNYERLILAAGADGLAQRALDEMIHYGNERVIDGNRPMSTYQGYAWQIGDMDGDLEAARVYACYAAQRADEGKLTNKMAANAFLQMSKQGNDITGNVIELAAGMGYVKDMPFEQLHRDAKLYRIGGGQRDIQREVRARSVLPAYAYFVKTINEITKGMDFSHDAALRHMPRAA